MITLKINYAEMTDHKKPRPHFLNCRPARAILVEGGEAGRDLGFVGFVPVANPDSVEIGGIVTANDVLEGDFELDSLQGFFAVFVDNEGIFTFNAKIDRVEKSEID